MVIRNQFLWLSLLLFSGSVMSDSLQPMDCSMPAFPILHHFPEIAQNCVRWVSDVVQPSRPVIPFSSCPQSFPASGSFPMSQVFASGGQSIGASVSGSVLSMNIKDWFPLGLTGLISLLSKGHSGVFSSTTVQKHRFFSAQPSLWSNSQIHTWLLEKPWLWLHGPLLAKWRLCFLIYCLGLSPLFFHRASVF